MNSDEFDLDELLSDAQLARLYHLSEEELIGYYEQTLSPEDRQQVERHLENCQRCKDTWQHMEDVLPAFEAGELERAPEALVLKALGKAGIELPKPAMGSTHPSRDNLVERIRRVFGEALGATRWVVTGSAQPLMPARAAAGAAQLTYRFEFEAWGDLKLIIRKHGRTLRAKLEVAATAASTAYEGKRVILCLKPSARWQKHFEQHVQQWHGQKDEQDACIVFRSEQGFRQGSLSWVLAQVSDALELQPQAGMIQDIELAVIEPD